jgi:hypothetical protein
VGAPEDAVRGGHPRPPGGRGPGVAPRKEKWQTSLLDVHAHHPGLGRAARLTRPAGTEPAPTPGTREAYGETDHTDRPHPQGLPARGRGDGGRGSSRSTPTERR